MNDDISGTGNDIEIKQKAHFKQKSFLIYNRGKFLEGIYKSLGYQDFKVLLILISISYTFKLSIKNKLSFETKLFV